MNIRAIALSIVAGLAIAGSLNSGEKVADRRDFSKPNRGFLAPGAMHGWEADIVLPREELYSEGELELMNRENRASI